MEGYRMQQPDVQFGVRVFWNSLPLLGIFEVPQRKLNDADEFGVSLEKCSCMGG
jgi:hypothetical protein